MSSGQHSAKAQGPSRLGTAVISNIQAQDISETSASEERAPTPEIQTKTSSRTVRRTWQRLKDKLKKKWRPPVPQFVPAEKADWVLTVLLGDDVDSGIEQTVTTQAQVDPAFHLGQASLNAGYPIGGVISSRILSDKLPRLKAKIKSCDGEIELVDGGSLEANRIVRVPCLSTTVTRYISAPTVRFYVDCLVVEGLQGFDMFIGDQGIEQHKLVRRPGVLRTLFAANEGHLYPPPMNVQGQEKQDAKARRDERIRKAEIAKKEAEKKKASEEQKKASEEQKKASEEQKKTSEERKKGNS